jgi:hypothetical protein
MPSLPLGGRLQGVILIGALLCFPGCTGRAASPKAALPVYSPEAARVFDDTFAPPLFGFDPEARVLAQDPKVRERTRLADFVLPARVETVSRVGGVEHRGAYEVTLAPSGPPLVGRHEGGPLHLTVVSSNPSYAWLEGVGGRWVGTRLLAFGRHYAGPTEPELHFRCEADSKELRDIVLRDAGLRLLR